MFRRQRQVKPDLTAEEAQSILAKLGDPAQPDPACQHCRGIHVRACPRVKRLVFRGGEVQEVEFWERWDESTVLYLDEVARVAGEN